MFTLKSNWSNQNPGIPGGASSIELRRNLCLVPGGRGPSTQEWLGTSYLMGPVGECDVLIQHTDPWLTHNSRFHQKLCNSDEEMSYSNAIITQELPKFSCLSDFKDSVRTIALINLFQIDCKTEFSSILLICCELLIIYAISKWGSRGTKSWWSQTRAKLQTCCISICIEEIHF